MSEAKLCHCVDCGGLFLPRELSRRGLCRPCALRRVKKARQQILKREGPIYEIYRTKMLLANQRRREES